MLKKILGAAFRNVKRFFGIWLVILIVNQLFIFGACFAPYCLAAALPHTLVIALLINLFGFRQDKSPSNSASAPARSSESTTTGVEATSVSADPGQFEQVKRRTRHLALFALIPIGIIGALLLAPSDSSWKSDSTSIAAFKTARDEVPNTEVPDERALPANMYVNDTASREIVGEVPDERAPPEELFAEDAASAPTAPANSSHIKYTYVIDKNGLTCPSETPLEHQVPGEELPRLGDWGHFNCHCTTDMGCVMLNPHVDEDSEEKTRKNIAAAPKGASCNNPVYWNEADQYIGQTYVVVGQVVKVTHRNDIRGKPTWVDVGATYPNAKRLSVVLWGADQTRDPLILPSHLEGRNICIVGKITSYKGTAQMELKYHFQFQTQ